MATEMAASLDDVDPTIAWLFLRRGLLLALNDSAWAERVLREDDVVGGNVTSLGDRALQRRFRQRPEGSRLRERIRINRSSNARAAPDTRASQRRVYGLDQAGNAHRRREAFA
jgi:hypothetical protein